MYIMRVKKNKNYYIDNNVIFSNKKKYKSKH